MRNRRRFQPAVQLKAAKAARRLAERLELDAEKTLVWRATKKEEKKRSEAAIRKALTEVEERGKKVLTLKKKRDKKTGALNRVTDWLQYISNFFFSLTPAPTCNFLSFSFPQFRSPPT